ncbi:MAG: cell division ATP-binding protein FtsE [Clostridia bacterium]
MIRMIDVSMTYPNGTQALRDVNFSVLSGEFVFIVGESGSGKSTLSKILTGELKQTDGRAVVNNFSIASIKRREIPLLRRSLGVVFQDFRLIDKKSIYDNVAFAMRVVGAPEKYISKRVKYVLELVGLSEKMNQKPDQISGGEKQRVAIARALVNNPATIIADEPTGNLDPARSLEIMTLLEKINELGTTVVIITHEKELVDQFSKRVIYLEEGRIIGDKTGGYEYEEKT